MRKNRKYGWLLILAVFFCAELHAQVTQLHIGKLVIDKRKTHVIRQRDSSANLLIDTLVMEDKSTLEFYAAKKASLTVNHAILGKQCIITGNDTKNNGTVFDLKIKFDKLESLFIVSRGFDYQTRPAFGNGDGGNITLKYASSGLQPQFDDRKKPAYVSIVNPGGGKAVTPQNDLYIIRSRIAMGAGNIGRPLTNLPQGRVYDGTPGDDGKKVIEKY